MTWMILLGVIALVFGMLLLASPGSLTRMSEGLNKMVTRVDDQVLQYRVGVGICMLIAALFLFLYAYMLGFA
jgi:drug/metabolite transporter (DMT)-like permease